MKKQLGSILFVAVCLAVSLIPLAGMTVKRTETTTENRVLAERPQIIEDSSYNTKFFPELGSWFLDHFAFKSQMVAADSILMGKVFEQSAVDTVVVGTDDWLYYTDSLDDYLGENTVSARGAYQIAHNLRIVQDKMEQEGIDFAFTIAPNKNSLYDDNMPYYYRMRASDVNNRALVVPLLEQLSVRYIDLYDAFREQDEVLYRRQDSHWNSKGAVLAYNQILDELGVSHNDFADVEITRVKTETGDLGRALYSVAAKPDWDYRYEFDSQISFLTDTTSWEDVWIQTEVPGKSGNLLMFRDSFGNTLSPLIAEEFGTASFAKDTIYHLDSWMELCQPDTVLFEIVERNLERFGEFSPENHSSGPPIMEAPYADADVYHAAAVESDTTLTAVVSDMQTSYLCLYGLLDEAYMENDTNVYVEVTADGSSNVYEAYTFTDAKSRGGGKTDT